MSIELTLSIEEARLLARAAKNTSKLMTDSREEKDRATLGMLAERISMILIHRTQLR